MAIRIRCTDCRKKISIDEAFVGGVCRCPYCKALVLVSGEGVAAEAGARPERPEAPTAPTPAGGETPLRAAVEAESIPLADPVRLQGIFTIILIGLMAMMVAAMVMIAYYMLRGPVPVGPAPLPPPPLAANPFAPPPDGGRGLGDVILAPPVVYCIDAGSSMAEFLDYAVAMTRVSAASLGPEAEINALACVEGGADPTTWYRWMLPEMSPAHERTCDALGEALAEVRPVGATDLTRALAAAIDAGANEIVLLARKPVGDPRAVTQPAIEREVRIHAIALGADAESVESLSALAEATGGQFRSYSTSQLQEWVSQAKLPR